MRWCDAANAKLENYQRVRGFSLWPGAALPRTSGTEKLKRAEIAKWLLGQAPPAASSEGSAFEQIVRKYAGDRRVEPGTSIEALGLSSLDRIQLLMELESRTGVSLNESAVRGGEDGRGIGCAETRSRPHRLSTSNSRSGVGPGPPARCGACCCPR